MHIGEVVGIVTPSQLTTGQLGYYLLGFFFFCQDARLITW
jgi:hypothetical protein